MNLRISHGVEFLVLDRIPLISQGNSIAFTSYTGSGKTLAYSLPFFKKINPKLGIQMIVLVPTRELCMQIGTELRMVCKKLDISVGVVYGGAPLVEEQKTLSSKNQIMIGTPGRLIHHINSKHLHVGNCKYIVFDESDQMFDDGFYSDCAYVLKRISKVAQICLSSATISEKVRAFIDFEMDEPILLKIGEDIPSLINQEKIYCEMDEKNKILLDFVRSKSSERFIVFVNTKVKVDLISSFLTKNKILALPLKGDLEQNVRTNTLNSFKDCKIKVLVTTDVAARGIHIKNVNYVINYDVPTKSEFYVHRIGRTGRDGLVGNSLTLICPEDVDRFEEIEKIYNLEVTLIKK